MLYIVDSFKVHNGEKSLTNKEDSCLKVKEAEDECCKGDCSSNTQNSIIKEKWLMVNISLHFVDTFIGPKVSFWKKVVEALTKLS